MNTFTGQEVADHIKYITPEESDVPDYFIDKYILPNDGWKNKPIKLKDLLKDRDFRDYYKSGEERYDEYEVSGDDLSSGDEAKKRKHLLDAFLSQAPPLESKSSEAETAQKEPKKPKTVRPPAEVSVLRKAVLGLSKKRNDGSREPRVPMTEMLKRFQEQAPKRKAAKTSESESEASVASTTIWDEAEQQRAKDRTALGTAPRGRGRGRGAGWGRRPVSYYTKPKVR